MDSELFRSLVATGIITAGAEVQVLRAIAPHPDWPPVRGTHCVDVVAVLAPTESTLAGLVVRNAHGGKMWVSSRDVIEVGGMPPDRVLAAHAEPKKRRGRKLGSKTKSKPTE